MGNKNISQWAKIFRGLANPYRLQIVKHLHDNGKTAVSELADKIGISIKNTSRNLRILHDLEILESLGKTDHVFYSVNAKIDGEINQILRLFCK